MCYSLAMKMAQNSPIPGEVRAVVDTLVSAGFEAYLVGGCVRDLFLGKNPKDWDVTTNAHPEKIQSLFPKTVYENTFGTVAIINETTEDETLHAIEVTPYRLESGYSDRRHPDKISFSTKIDDDLKRRDFTINAIAVSLSNGAIKDIVDNYAGFKDIKDRTIKTVGDASDRFTEDALRMIRGVRLAVELGFTIEKDTYKAIQSHNKLIKEVSIERIRDEFTKTIMSPEPQKGLIMLHETGLLQHFIPELEVAIGVEQGGVHIYDVWEHLLKSLQGAADKGWPLEIRLAALFHDISKPKTRALNRPVGNVSRGTSSQKSSKKEYSFHGHEVVGSRETRKILERMKFSRATIEKVTKLVRWHMFFADTEQITIAAVRRMTVNVGRENIWDLMNVRICDRIGTGRPKEDPYRLRKYKAMIEEALRDPISLSMLKIDGKGLMDVCKISPGPRIGNILHALFEEVLEDPKLNSKEYLEKRAIELNKLSDEELKKMGEEGKERKEEADQKNIEEIRKKYHVS